MNAVLIDVTRCRGCEECVAACVAANSLPPSRSNRDRITSADGLSAHRLSTVVPVADGRFAKKSCMHCLEPSCVSACLVGGLTRTEDGAVVYDPAKCIGCRYCMLACPFQVPRYDWDSVAPLVHKCDLCVERTTQGKAPACVDACPHEALVFGEREELLAEAHRRIKAAPSTYLDRVWGEHEFGGTSVLYVSDVELDELGWPDETTEPIPSLTDPIIAKTPHMGLGVAGCLLGISWIIRRRNEVAAQTNPEEAR